MTKAGIYAWVATLCVISSGWTTLLAAESRPAASWNEAYQLLKQNLPGITEAELNRAALEGLVFKLQPRAKLVDPAETEKEKPAPVISRTNLFDGSIGYVRIARVVENLPTALAEVIRALEKTNKLRGVAIDLRYAEGENVPAAAAAADLFVTRETTLLKWREENLKSKAAADDVRVPVAVLINYETSGAAEVLAALIRDAGVGLLIGSKTAGAAAEFKEFPLPDGRRLRIATGPLVLGGGTELSSEALSPDIAVEVRPEDERVYFADAFKAIPRLELTSPGLSLTNQVASRPRRTRISEADLVRDRREGTGLDELPPVRSPDPELPIVHDPALARALDLLKGLAVVRQSGR